MIKKIFYIVFFLGLLLNPIIINNLNAKSADFKIGVNRFAWYGALQTLSFMPLSSADPFSGVIITDWYEVVPNERYKLVVYILEENLTSNTVSVKVFKQTKSAGQWNDAVANKSMNTKIENSILNLARQLRIQYVLRNQ